MKTLTILTQMTVLKRSLIMFGLLCFIVIGLQTGEAINEVLMSQLSTSDLLVTILFGIISQSGLLLAIAYFLALFFFLTQLYEENEMYILFTLGTSEARLLVWLLPPTTLIAFTVALLTFFLTPLSASLVDGLSASQAQSQLQKVRNGKIYFNGNEAMRQQEEHLHFIRVTKKGALIVVGEKDFETNKLPGSIRLKVRDGTWLLRQKGDTEARGDFERMELIIRSQHQLGKLLRSRPTRNLWGGSSREMAELYQRAAVFLVVPVSVPLAMIFSRRRPKQKNLLLTLGGILCYLLYIHFVIFSIDIIRGGGGDLSFWLIQAAVLLSCCLPLFVRLDRTTLYKIGRDLMKMKP